MHQPIWRNAVSAVPLVLALSTSLAAQWPAYPTPGIPKTPDGKPNLTAPAPRTAEGKPDLTGVWEPSRPPVVLPNKPPEFTAEGYPYAVFFDAAPGLKGGLPLTPAGAELVKQRAARNFGGNPDGACLPLGVMILDTHPQPRKVFQMPGVLVILNEQNYGVRQIFTDGRPLPRNNPQPWWYGYSVGTWEGDTLVVRSSGFRDGGWLDFNTGAPLTDAATVTERFRRVNVGTLAIDVTVDDPKAYTKPWTVRVDQHLLLNTELIETICLEGQELTRPEHRR